MTNIYQLPKRKIRRKIIFLEVFKVTPTLANTELEVSKVTSTLANTKLEVSKVIPTLANTKLELEISIFQCAEIVHITVW